MAGPLDDHRHADAAVVHGALDAGHRAVGVKEADVVSALAVWAVVGREKDNRVFVQPVRLESPDNLPHHLVEVRNHCGLSLVLLRPFLVLVNAVIRHGRAVTGFAEGLVVGVR